MSKLSEESDAQGRAIESALNKGVAVDDMTDDELNGLQSALGAMIATAVYLGGPEDENEEDDTAGLLLMAAWTVGADVIDEIRRRPHLRSLLSQREGAWKAVRAFVNRTSLEEE